MTRDFGSDALAGDEVFDLPVGEFIGIFLLVDGSDVDSGLAIAFESPDKNSAVVISAIAVPKDFDGQVLRDATEVSAKIVFHVRYVSVEEARMIQEERNGRMEREKRV